MTDAGVNFHFDVDGDDFSSAGAASVEVKKRLRQLGFPPDVIRKVAIAMYEGEINMVIHANGGTADVLVLPDEITMVLRGPGTGDCGRFPCDAGRLFHSQRQYSLSRLRRRHGAPEYEKVHGYHGN